MASCSPPIADPDPYSTLPPQPVASTRLEVDKLVAFVEIWDRSQNFSGEPYNLLDDKVRMMLHWCYELDIQPSQFHTTFSKILTGEALLYYIDNIHYDDTFATTYKKFKDHFDVKHHNYYLTVLTCTRFKSFRQEYRAKHPGGEDLHKVLESMLDRLKLCQRALGPGYAGDQQLKGAVKSACREVPEFHDALALSRVNHTSVELFDSLRICLYMHLNTDPDAHSQRRRYLAKTIAKRLPYDCQANPSTVSRHRALAGMI